MEVKDTTKKLFSNLVKLMPGASLYHFGVLQSKVHMVWTKAICGYKDFRPRYSTDIVFNNFPWPELTEKNKESIAKTARRSTIKSSHFPADQRFSVDFPAADTAPPVEIASLFSCGFSFLSIICFRINCTARLLLCCEASAVP